MVSYATVYPLTMVLRILVGTDPCAALMRMISSASQVKFVALRVWAKSFSSIFAPALPQGPIAVFDRSG